MADRKQMTEFFDSLAEHWDERMGANLAVIRMILDKIPLKDKRVMDIGCGTGALLGEILLRDPRQLQGVDLSEKMIARARAKYDDPRLSLIAGDFFDLGGEFDVAILHNSYPHFENKQALASRVSQLLSNMGRIVITHSLSRHAVNEIHRHKAKAVSVLLHEAEKEAKILSSFYEFDVIIDSDEFYLLSGIKKI